MLSIFSLFQKIINMAKRNFTFDNDWFIEFEWVEKGPMHELCIVNYVTVHLIFLISEELQSLAIQKGKKHKDKEISSKSLPISFFAKKKSDVMSLTLSDLDKDNVHLLCPHLQMCSIRSWFSPKLKCY